MATARTRFTATLAYQYHRLFKRPAFSDLARKYTPEQLAERVTGELLAGTGDMSGEGIRRTCKALGIECTLGGIAAYLASGGSDTGSMPIRRK